MTEPEALRASGSSEIDALRASGSSAIDALRASGSSEVERHQYDVVVIGAGGAGLRAVIEARGRGLKVAVVCKSLFGKAHTVMAEGGCAASMGNTNPKDNWQVHFGDTMRGG